MRRWGDKSMCIIMTHRVYSLETNVSAQALSDHRNSKRAAMNGADVRQFSHMVLCARAFAAQTGWSRRIESCIGHLRIFFSRNQMIVMARRAVSDGRISRLLLAPAPLRCVASASDTSAVATLQRVLRVKIARRAAM